MSGVSKANEQSPYLHRPLYLYDLPPELINTLVLQSTVGTQLTSEASEAELPARQVNDDGVSTSTACNLCKSTFRDVNDQRQHVRSDFHKYNLKLLVKQLPPIDEATFIRNIGDLDESISGSDTDESEGEASAETNDSTLSALLRKQAKLSHENGNGEQQIRRKRGPGNAPMYWLTSPKLPDGYGLGFYKAAFTSADQDAMQTRHVDLLKSKQIQPLQSKHSGAKQQPNLATTSPHFFLCMIGGGHFAAAIIGLAPEIRKGPGRVEERHATILAHKTFHRYTTRRKQGGSQSANDNAKGNAHSVGSSIRRANEAALVVDIRNLLAEWKSMIDTAELVFVRATGSQNRNTIFGPYDGQVLTPKDNRVRGFPFSTRRATQNEIIRAFQELTRVKVEKLVEEEPERSVEDSTSKAPTKKAVPPKPTVEEEQLLLHTSQLQNLIRRSKAPGILLYLKKNNISANFNFFPPAQGTNHHAPTPLHLAASQNAAAVVVALLTKADADPTLRNDDGRVPYDIAGDSKTHDAFRIARHTLGDSQWDWTAAHVPSPLTPEEAEARSKRDQADASAAETARRQADLEQIKADEEARKVGQIEKKAGPGHAIGGLPEKTWAEKNDEDLRGLTPEIRQRLERERRARAAEARMKAMASHR